MENTITHEMLANARKYIAVRKNLVLIWDSKSIFSVKGVDLDFMGNSYAKCPHQGTVTLTLGNNILYILYYKYVLYRFYFVCTQKKIMKNIMRSPINT